MPRMELNNADTPRKSSPKFTNFLRDNSRKFGNAAESVVVPRNKRSMKEHHHTREIDLERSESTDSVDPDKRFFPWLITLIVFIQFGVMIFSKGWTWLSFCYDPYRRHEVWRFISVSLVHLSILHLVANVLFELIFGLTLEAIHGWKRTGGIFISGVAAGSLAVTVVQPKNYVLGASAGVYGLLAAHFVTLVFNWDQMERRVLRLVCLVVYIIFDVSLAFILPNPNVSHVGHLGGAIGGFIAAVFLLKNFEVLEWERKFKKIIGIGGFVTILTIVIINVSFVSYYFPTEFNVDYVQTYFRHIIYIFNSDEKYAELRAICAQDEKCSEAFAAANISLSTTASPFS